MGVEFPEPLLGHGRIAQGPEGGIPQARRGIPQEARQEIAGAAMAETHQGGGQGVQDGGARVAPGIIDRRTRGLRSAARQPGLDLGALPGARVEARAIPEERGGPGRERKRDRQGNGPAGRAGLKNTVHENGRGGGQVLLGCGGAGARALPPVLGFTRSDARRRLQGDDAGQQGLGHGLTRSPGAEDQEFSHQDAPGLLLRRQPTGGQVCGGARSPMNEDDRLELGAQGQPTGRGRWLAAEAAQACQEIGGGPGGAGQGQEGAGHPRPSGGAGGLLATGAFHQGAEERDLHCFRPGPQRQELAPGPLPHGPVSVRGQLQEQVGLHPTGLRRGPTAQVTGQGQARVRQGIAGQLSQQRCRDACARGRLKSAGLTVDQVA